MFLPYVKGDEVWGIAKIYDKPTMNALVNYELSTSPSVVFRDTKVNYTIEMDDGSTLLVEGEPSFVDHLAICEKGVWDKGGDASGVRIDADSLASGEPQEQKVTAKPDFGAEPEPPLPVNGGNEEPAPVLQGIPPGLADLAGGLQQFADRLEKFMTRRDLMVR
jgi:hypothetical protein